MTGQEFAEQKVARRERHLAEWHVLQQELEKDKLWASQTDQHIREGLVAVIQSHERLLRQARDVLLDRADERANRMVVAITEIVGGPLIAGPKIEEESNAAQTGKE